MAQNKPRVVVVGAGFGGLEAARKLARLPVRVTLIDRKNHHTFQPLLYQVATAGISPGEIAAPVRWILRGRRNVEVLLGQVTGFDLVRKTVQLPDFALSYDYLIVAAGARHSYFGHDEWAPLAPGLKTIEDALEIRRRVLLAFELAERATLAGEPEPPLNFVIVGAGPTGVELAGTLAEIARKVLQDEFATIDPRRTRIILLEGGPRVLPVYPPDLSASAVRQLGHGDQYRTGCSLDRRRAYSSRSSPLGCRCAGFKPRQEVRRSGRSRRTRSGRARSDAAWPSRGLRYR